MVWKRVGRESWKDGESSLCSFVRRTLNGRMHGVQISTAAFWPNG